MNDYNLWFNNLSIKTKGLCHPKDECQWGKVILYLLWIAIIYNLRNDSTIILILFDNDHDLFSNFFKCLSESFFLVKNKDTQTYANFIYLLFKYSHSYTLYMLN